MGDATLENLEEGSLSVERRLLELGVTLARGVNTGDDAGDNTTEERRGVCRVGRSFGCGLRPLGVFSWRMTLPEDSGPVSQMQKFSDLADPSLSMETSESAFCGSDGGKELVVKNVGCCIFGCGEDFLGEDLLPLPPACRGVFVGERLRLDTGGGSMFLDKRRTRLGLLGEEWRPNTKSRFW